MEHLTHILLLLAVAMTVVVIFQRLHIPTSLGYLLVGVILGPHTIGPMAWGPELATLAEFGVVFLLFTIGLNFSLPQLQAMRHQVLGLGVGQVVLTTLLVGVITWLVGLSMASAFVIGAVFAQSSTTIIASLLNEQGEEASQHGRLGLAMSVFQDVTAVPFLVIIPVLGVAVAPQILAGTLGLALIKAIIAFALIFYAGRWILRPLFQFISNHRSLEIFTLAVLLVALVAAWTTNSLGLSLAFGGFLAGMMLGETEFRHQVESSMRPFRDVLLGLFFIGIGTRLDLLAIPPIWHWALLGAALILASKVLIVTALAYRAGLELQSALRSGLLLSVGGEFGLALVAIALDQGVIDDGIGQSAIAAVLLAMILGAILIRFNGQIASCVSGNPDTSFPDSPGLPEIAGPQVIIGGYGRVGHTIAVLLHSTGIPFIAFDTDPQRVAYGKSEGHAVFYGDALDPELLSAIRVERATLLVITAGGTNAALRAISFVTGHCTQVPVIVRARDIDASRTLLAAGAAHAFPEAIEASLQLGVQTLQMLHVQPEDIDEVVQNVRDWGYRPILENTSARVK